MALLLTGLCSALIAVGLALLPQIAKNPPTSTFPSQRASLWKSRILNQVPKGLTTRELTTAISVTLATATSISIMIASPLPLITAPIIFSKIASSIKHTKLEKLRKEAASEWPNILSELHLRITSMGAPIHHGLFSAAKSAKATLRHAFDYSERTFAITNSIELALDSLYRDLPFTTTFRVVEALKVVLEVPGGDVAGIIADLKDDLEREWRQHNEFGARLKGVKFARNFVVIVPIAMFLAGASIGGFGSYRGFASIVTLSLSAIVVFVCWVIVSKMTSSSTLYKGDINFIGSAFRKRVER